MGQFNSWDDTKMDPIYQLAEGGQIYQLAVERSPIRFLGFMGLIMRLRRFILGRCLG